MTLAPTVRARETVKPIFPAVVLTYTDALRLLADVEHALTPAEIAEMTERDPSNVRRDIAKLRDAGVIEIANTPGLDKPPTWTITDKGRRWLAGQDLAEGKAPPAAAQSDIARWPLDQLVPNPDNPRKAEDPEAIAALAASIMEVGDLLQPLVVSAPDANGVRMVWAGHRRLAALKSIFNTATLPYDLNDSVGGGIPIKEHRSPIAPGHPDNRAEGLRVALIENHQRADITPWEDAQALALYAAETGKSARQVAFDLGRARQGSETGVRDVQQKIKVAMGADAADIALHLKGLMTWEALRASVYQSKPVVLSSPTPAAEDPRPADESPRQPVQSTAPQPAPQIALTPREGLILLELDHWVQNCDPSFERHARNSGEDLLAAVGRHWLDQSAVSLAARGLINFETADRPYACLTWEGERALIGILGGRSWATVEDLNQAMDRAGITLAAGASYGIDWIDRPLAPAQPLTLGDALDQVTAAAADPTPAPEVGIPTPASPAAELPQPPADPVIAALRAAVADLWIAAGPALRILNDLIEGEVGVTDDQMQEASKALQSAAFNAAMFVPKDTRAAVHAADKAAIEARRNQL